LIRASGKLIRQTQGQLVVETRNAPTIPFDIFTNIKYCHVKLANDEATSCIQCWSWKKYQKTSVLLVEEERKMLGQAICHATSRRGLNLPFYYFFMLNFLNLGLLIIKEC
jgi:hypothetical protein